jgi:hypothetical protein
MGRLLTLLIIASVALSPALAADAPKNAVATKRIPQKDVPLEDLAHSFFYHSSRMGEQLRGLVSPGGVAALEPAIEDHQREMADSRRVVAKVRKMCKELERASTGVEFAAVFSRWEEQDRIDARHAARRILSVLDPYDRKALENYLDKEYRKAVSFTRMDYEALFTPFPNEHSSRLMQRTCVDAVKLEEMVKP